MYSSSLLCKRSLLPSLFLPVGKDMCQGLRFPYPASIFSLFTSDQHSPHSTGTLWNGMGSVTLGTSLVTNTPPQHTPHESLGSLILPPFQENL